MILLVWGPHVEHLILAVGQLAYSGGDSRHLYDLCFICASSSFPLFCSDTSSQIMQAYTLKFSSFMGSTIFNKSLALNTILHGHARMFKCLKYKCDHFPSQRFSQMSQLLKYPPVSSLLHQRGCFCSQVTELVSSWCVILHPKSPCLTAVDVCYCSRVYGSGGQTFWAWPGSLMCLWSAGG